MDDWIGAYCKHAVKVEAATSVTLRGKNALHKRVSWVNSEHLSAPPVNLLSEGTLAPLLSVNVPLEMLQVAP